MVTNSRPELRHKAALPSLGVADRRSVPDRRAGSDRRHTAERRRSVDSEALISELERRVAAAIRQQGDRLEGNGSGWDKLIVPFA